MTEDLVYLDNNATTRLAPEVVEAMLPYLEERYGNPSSPYSFARSAALAVDDARRSAAGLIGADPGQVVFTSGGSESNAMALLGALPGQKPRDEIVISAVEHASIWAWRDRLDEMGYKVKVAPVDGRGILDLDEYAGLLSGRTALVSVMLANNETGVISPVKKAAELAHQAGALIHSDVVQAVGKIPLNVKELGLDFASSCCHKHHGPKGIGFLYLAARETFTPSSFGGEQESGLRPGTEPTHQLAGLGSAADLAGKWLSGDGPDRIAGMRETFEAWVDESLDGVLIAGAGVDRLPNTTLLMIDGVETEAMLALLDMENIACSSGSACSSGAHEASHVLTGMGIDLDSGGRPRGVLRISASRYTEPGDYVRLQEVLPDIVTRLRS